MVFTELPLGGAFVIEPERLQDERGFFARTFCAVEFARRGLVPVVAQCSISYNRLRGTLRGLHFQRPPHQEAKLVWCLRGAVYDVIVDLRAGSETFSRWWGTELSAESRRMLYVPEGFAHGFQTLADDTEILYQISASYVPQAAAGIRWDDPDLGISWPPAPERRISERDLLLPTLRTHLAAGEH